MSVNPVVLRIGAHIEFASLLLTLANLATVHHEAASSLLGPVHGCSYLFVAVGAWACGRATPAARLLTLVPGVGGPLAVRRIPSTPGPDGGRTPREPLQGLKRPRVVQEPQHPSVRRSQDGREG